MKNNKTAIEWLLIQIANDKLLLDKSKWRYIRNKAKSIEREQIMDAFRNGYSNGNIDTCLSNEQYYNETYGGDK
jgi:hypothetical protein